MLRHILLTALTLFALTGDCLANDDLLKRVPQLQETARLANGGALGCGVGTVTLITSRGQIKAQSSLDPIRVFGGTIRVSDLLALLEARAEFNRTRVANPMSGEVSDLTYVVLYTLSLAKDPISVPVIAELLLDGDDVIRGRSAIALYEIAKSGEGLRAKVKKIKFPQAAVQSARARGKEPPAWLQLKPGN
jgi:hypothetical protein